MNDEIKALLSNREIWIGKSKVRLGEYNILHVTVLGEQNGEDARAAVEGFEKITHVVKGKIHHLVDLNKGGKQSREARKYWHKLSEHERTGKIALHGMHPVARILASFVMGATGKKDLRFFKTKEEALVWLKE